MSLWFEPCGKWREYFQKYCELERLVETVGRHNYHLFPERLEEILQQLMGPMKRLDWGLKKAHMRLDRFLMILAMLIAKLLEALRLSGNFSGYPNKYRPPCTTMPWNIPPALLVLWGVCWMFYIPPSNTPPPWEPDTVLEQGLPSANLVRPSNVAHKLDPFEHISQSSLELEGWLSRAYLQPSTAPTLPEQWDIDAHFDREQANFRTNNILQFGARQSSEAAMSNHLLQPGVAASNNHLTTSNCFNTLPTTLAAETTIPQTLAVLETTPNPDQRTQAPREPEARLTCDRDGCNTVTFQRRSAYEKHMNKHDRPFRCEVPGCTHPNGFGSKGYLERHNRSKHRSTLPDTTAAQPRSLLLHYCPEASCHRSAASSANHPFARKDHLQEHIRRKHGDHQPQASSCGVDSTIPTYDTPGPSDANLIVPGSSAEPLPATAPGIGKRRRLESGTLSQEDAHCSSTGGQMEELRRKINDLERKLEAAEKREEGLIEIIKKHIK